MKKDRDFSNTLFYILKNVYVIIVLVIVAYPIIYVLSASLSSPGAMSAGRVWLYPVQPTLVGYQAVLSYSRIWWGYLNSFYYTVFGTFICVAVTLMAAYPPSRKDFKGRGVYMFVLVFTMLFNGGIIPFYMLIVNLKLMDTVWALVLPGAVSAYYVILTKTYFQTQIPFELLEAAKIDGCSNFKFFLSVALPLSKPIIAVIALFAGIVQWNSYVPSLLFISSENRYPLQIILREILVLNTVDPLAVNYQSDEGKQNLYEIIKYAVIVVGCLPLLIAYPFVQKFFVKGVMIGSLKG